ncbi:hypothetical protein H1R20_g13470, partial [Candolleomyces eurysporus]
MLECFAHNDTLTSRTPNANIVLTWSSSTTFLNFRQLIQASGVDVAFIVA